MPTEAPRRVLVVANRTGSTVEVIDGGADAALTAPEPERWGPIDGFPPEWVPAESPGALGLR
jgi:hypothetical protein